MEENHRPPPQRTLGDFMTPTVIRPIGSVVGPNVEPNNFELKPALVQLVQKEQFAGTSAEDPYLHIENFLLLSDMVKINGVTRDAILLRLFTYSLKDDARRWLQSLPQGSITTWDDLQIKFLARFFSASKRAKLKDEITWFKQKELESIYEAWERFKTLLRKSGGSLTTKTPQKALDIFESLASQEFDNAPLFSQNVASVDTNSVCAICGKGHVTEDCDYGGSAEQAEVNGVWYDQRNQNNQGRNLYVPPWKNRNQHPGFSYSSNHQLNPPLHPPPPHSSQQGDTSAWEKAFAQLSKTTTEYIQENVKEDKKEDEVVVENNSSPKKLMKWEKKKMADKQDQPINLSPHAKVPYPQRLKQEI
ncbi:uncharacterized protein LOC133311831 [Gastrolobium bilobum]|uniref:uncharacterized protein LOC133311831 n=1 Tax=Gastrolobium bilobum TaxID=150636 RepID=UPI002AB144CF|nr:uncharacterized protein LOC133311831 [Gastrolobium bilobum]